MSDTAVPSLDTFRRAARRLKKSVAAGDAEALARIRAHVSADRPIRHADCLHVIAREDGFESWPKLKFSVELQSLTHEQRAKQLETALANGRHWVTEKLLAEFPDLADDNLGLQIALYDREAVQAVLEADPLAAARPIGVRRPILHLAFSKDFRRRPDRQADMMAIAELLLENGADVNDGHPPEPGSEHRLSALYAALCHADNFELGRWLLEKGADPNDHESLYHSTELGHTRALELLLNHGARVNGTNALPRAIDFNDARMVRLLLEHGADPNCSTATHPSGEPVEGVPALHQAARRSASFDIAELLLDRGADPAFVWNGHTAYGFARIYGNRKMAECLAGREAATTLSPNEIILADCADGTWNGVRLDRSGLSDEAGRLLTRLASMPGRLEHIKALVGAGLDPNEADEMGLPALHVAGWNGFVAELELFLSFNPDLDYRNGFGGNAIETVIHGAENAPKQVRADHVSCARFLLAAGAEINVSHVRACGAEDLALFLESHLSG
jgi:ankyrin repeat protein